MSVNINADTTNGLVLTSDTTGEIKLQSAGADIATVDSSGITMASGKTLPASALTGSLPAGMGGKILQVVQDRHSSQVLTSSGTYQDTGLTATITPSSTSSKILIIVDQNGTYANGAGNIQFQSKLFRDATELASSTSGLGTSQTLVFGTVAFNYLDSPATTSAITYKTQFANSGGTGDIGFNTYGNSSGITLMEIAG